MRYKVGNRKEERTPLVLEKYNDTIQSETGSEGSDIGPAPIFSPDSVASCRNEFLGDDKSRMPKWGKVQNNVDV